MKYLITNHNEDLRINNLEVGNYKLEFGFWNLEIDNKW